VEALKELTLRDKLGEVQQVVSENRRRATRARANVSFLNVVPKYAFEAALIGGFLLVGAAAAMMGGTSQAVAAVTLFAATGFRMIPAMNAVQTSLTSASSAEVFVKDIIRELNVAETLSRVPTTAVDREELPVAEAARIARCSIPIPRI
jgi:ABC-type multidrug transport system fused ATPase/permease subunit